MEGRGGSRNSIFFMHSQSHNSNFKAFSRLFGDTATRLQKTHTAQCCGSFRPTLTQKDSFMDVLAAANGNGPARHSGSTGCAGESAVADSLHRITSHRIASGGKVANIHEDMYSQGLSHVK